MTQHAGWVAAANSRYTTLMVVCEMVKVTDVASSNLAALWYLPNKRGWPRCCSTTATLQCTLGLPQRQNATRPAVAPIVEVESQLPYSACSSGGVVGRPSRPGCLWC
jgi:hypothetical protein